ncbi:MAG: alpha/beta hydrolase [Clostridiales bacterium]|nr:alpha/beta hydrolase [Clostridiales bacterium]
MVKKWTVTIPQLTGTEPRRAYIYLPESYDFDTERWYPVLYMFDGHNVFFDWDATYGKSWGLKEYMDATQTQMIIAAVECDRSPDNGRLSEYSPFDFSDPEWGSFQGRGRITMDWYVEEFKAFIDAHFRTVPDREATFIAGSSMGGLMSLYAVAAYNDVFSGAAALSPSLWVSPQKLYQLIRETRFAKGTRVYLDYGSEEVEFHSDMIKQFARVTQLLLEKHVLVTSRIVPGGDHSEASWEKQAPFYMEALLFENG